MSTLTITVSATTITSVSTGEAPTMRITTTTERKTITSSGLDRTTATYHITEPASTITSTSRQGFFESVTSRIFGGVESTLTTMDITSVATETSVLAPSHLTTFDVTDVARETTFVKIPWDATQEVTGITAPPETVVVTTTVGGDAGRAAVAAGRGVAAVGWLFAALVM